MQLGRLSGGRRRTCLWSNIHTKPTLRIRTDFGSLQSLAVVYRGHVHVTKALPATVYSIKHGDCVLGMKMLDAQSVDVVVTSPPYNIGIAYNSYKDNLEHEEYLAWCNQWGAEIRRTLKSDGSFFLNVGATSGNPLFPFEVANAMRRSGLALQNIIHWIKSISIEREDGTKSYGHFKPINSGRFLNDCQEYVFHFTPEGKTPLDRLGVGVPYADKSNVARWSHTNGRDKRCRGNTWFIPYETITQRAKDRPHPATFPTDLAVKCIRLHGRKNAVVMDPFLGIGHSALAAGACSDLVSKFIGFDIDEEYLKVCCALVGTTYSSVNPPARRPSHDRGTVQVRTERSLKNRPEALLVS